MRIQNLFTLGIAVALGTLMGCSADNGASNLPNNNVGGSNSTLPTGGKTNGGAGTVGGTTGVVGATGGTATGLPTGGKTSTGGSASGMPTGGSATGLPTGGKTSTGGSASGTPTGGSGTGMGTGGKTSTGGTGAGTPTGGSGTGVGTGGKSSTGGSGAGTATGGTGTGNGTGGSTSTGARPKGYWYTADWSVSKVDWHGCVWTGIDTVAGTKTTIAPQDFMSGVDGGPYEVAGSVNGAYESVALLGFNLNEAINGKADQCKYSAATATAAGPPSVSMTSIKSSTAGLAINWTAKTKPGQFRVQLQAPDSATNLAHSWCATITDATGPSFVKWTDFYAYCWDYPTPVDSYAAVQYKGEDVDAVSFLVPGVLAATPFDFTVVGFATGNSAADAPGKVQGCGAQTGTLGNGPMSKDASMQRAAVTDSTCKKYIAFNNNWGNPTGSTQTIDYAGNSFTVKSSTGTGSSAPASFPCIYVGASGDLGGGTFNTWTDTGLPKQISAMTSAQSTFNWTGNTGNYNSTYDIWFAKSPPTAGAYNDAISGFIMVWLYKPDQNQPIGSVKRTATIAGHTWNVWVGPRGNTSVGTDPAGRPVVSYVAQDGPVKNFTADLKLFFDDAVKNAAADMSAGGTSQAFSNTWYLTDVFAGFEAWSGGAIVNNTAKMSIVVK